MKTNNPSDRREPVHTHEPISSIIIEPHRQSFCTIRQMVVPCGHDLLNRQSQTWHLPPSASPSTTNSISSAIFDCSTRMQVASVGQKHRAWFFILIRLVNQIERSELSTAISNALSG